MNKGLGTIFISCVLYRQLVTGNWVLESDAEKSDAEKSDVEKSEGEKSEL